MTSFGWKRKAGQNVSKSKSQAFEDNSKNEEDDSLDDYDIDWLHLAATKKVFTLEDAKTKSARLQQEGETLAAAERYWEAIQKWDSALQFTPDNSSLFEMKAQCLLCLNELMPAEAAAKKAVEYDPKWWVAHVTLGRAQMNLGEVKLAIKSFSRALHINPDNLDVWTEDLSWAFDLYKKHQGMLAKVDAEDQKLQIKELNDEEDDQQKQIIVKRPKIDNNFLLPITEESQSEIKYMPQNMVKFRF